MAEESNGVLDIGYWPDNAIIIAADEHKNIWVIKEIPCEIPVAGRHYQQFGPISPGEIGMVMSLVEAWSRQEDCDMVITDAVTEIIDAAKYETLLRMH